MISIIIPCYQCIATLQKCVDSVIAQSYADIEIILVDDGSPDSTGEMCDELVQTDNRIKVIHQKNRGLVGAWKAGVLASKGQYINFVDSDDWMERDALSRMIQKIEQYNAEMVVCGTVVEYSNGKTVLCDNRIKEGIYDRKSIEESILPLFFHMQGMESRPLIIGRWSKLIRKELLLRNMHMFDERISYGEDDMTIFTLTLSCKSLYCFQGFYPYHYCRNDASMIGGYDPDGYQKCLALNKKLSEIAQERNYPYSEQLQIHFFENCMLVLKKAMHRNKQDSICEIAKNMKQIVEREELQQAFIKCSAVIKEYGLKEKIFISLLEHRHYLLCVMIVKILAKLQLCIQ